MPIRRILRAALLVTIVTVAIAVPSAWGEKNESACSKPPELIPGPKPSKEEQKKADKLRAQGLFVISISEEGNVVDAVVIRPSSPEAAAALLARAKSMKFKPRPGCGIKKITVNYTLANR